MAKPILVISVNSAAEAKHAAQNPQIQAMSAEYWILFKHSNVPNIEVFYEKDQSPLDQDKLNELLKYAIKEFSDNSRGNRVFQQISDGNTSIPQPREKGGETIDINHSEQ